MGSKWNTKDYKGNPVSWYSEDLIKEIKEYCEKEKNNYRQYPARNGKDMIIEYSPAYNFACKILNLINKEEAENEEI